MKLPDFEANEALANAKVGDYRLLVKRHLRNVSTPPEKELIGKIVLSARKPAKQRPAFSVDKIDRDIAIYNFVDDKLEAGKALKTAKGEAAERWPLSESSIDQIFASYKAMAEEVFPPGPGYFTNVGVYNFVDDRVLDGIELDAAVAEAAKKFGLSESRVSEIIDQLRWPNN